MFNFSNIRRAFRASKYGKVALAVLFVGLVLASAVLAGDLRPTAPAGAATVSITPCPKPATDAEVRAIRDSMKWTWDFLNGKATVTNTSKTCAYEFSLKVFKVMSETNDHDQVLFDNDTQVVPAGATRSFSVNLPSCRYQLDLLIFPGGTYTSAKLMEGKIRYALPACTVNVPSVIVTCSATPNPANTNQTVTWKAFPSGGNGSFTYNWTGSGVFPDGAKTQSVNTSYANSGTKDATVTVTSGGKTATANCSVVVVAPPVVAPAVACSPLSQNVNIGDAAHLTATGGNAPYTWSVSGGGLPATGSGSSFNPVFSTSGTKTVTVTSGYHSAQCTVVVAPIVIGDIVCSPLNQTADVNDTVNFSATGGDGVFNWTASGGSTSTGSGSSFHTAYGTSGSKHVLVSDNSGHSAQCNAQINPIVVNAPVCNPSSQSVDIDENASFSATGGNGTFSWSVSGSGASDNSGSGSSFNTSFGTAGTKTVTVTSNGLSDSCAVTVNEDNIIDDLSCSPSSQDVDVEDFVTFRASGGSGTYHWTADDGNADPDSDTGRTFTTQFFDNGTFSVQVRDSAGNSATCRVRVDDNFTVRRPSCSPSSQTASVNEQVEFFANGGTGNFEWDARDGSRRSGFGSRFTTSFDSPGRYTVRLDSNGETDTCSVTIEDNNDNGAPFCSPSTQNASVNDFVTFSASGGNGNYFWATSADGSPSTGNGSSFGARFITPGTKFVTVSSNGRTSQCLVQIGSVLGASTIITGPTETAAAAAGLGFLGALGAYAAVYRERSKKFFSKLTRLVRR